MSATDRHTILALDPGVTTGICMATYEDKKLYITPDEAKLGMDGMYKLLLGLVDSVPHNVHVVYEDFSYRNASRMGLDLTPVKIIGIIELFRDWHEPIITFTKQSASTGKTFYTDERLKQLGAYIVGKQHGRDATRHLLQWANFGEGARWVDLPETEIIMAEMK